MEFDGLPWVRTVLHSKWTGISRSASEVKDGRIASVRCVGYGIQIDKRLSQGMGDVLDGVDFSSMRARMSKTQNYAAFEVLYFSKRAGDTLGYLL